MARFFVPQECIKGNTAFIVGQEAHHILDVMRLKRQDKITVFDGSGKLYQGKILNTERKLVKVQIERVLKEVPLSNLEITLVQALPKKSKMDYIIEKCTELGVDSIIPIQTARTIVKLDRVRENSRNRRWQRIAQEAAKQCARTTVPQVKNLASWENVLSILGDFDLKLLACLSAKTKKIKDVLRSEHKANRIILFVGPEGDFTPDELQQACAAGCVAVSLGNNVLKSDSACISALAMINYELKQ